MILVICLLQSWGLVADLLIVSVTHRFLRAGDLRRRKCVDSRRRTTPCFSLAPLLLHAGVAENIHTYGVVDLRAVRSLAWLGHVVD